MSNHDCKQGRSCDELGMCQQRKPACNGCTVPTPAPLTLAPGVLEGYRIPKLGTPAQRRELVRVFKSAAIWLAVLGTSALAAGYLSGRLP